jgi:hypothetical protein
LIVIDDSKECSFGIWVKLTVSKLGIAFDAATVGEGSRGRGGDGSSGDRQSEWELVLL